MSKKKTSRVLVAGACLVTLLTPYGLEVPKVYAEMTMEDKEKEQEERVYQLLPKGNVEEMRELHQRRMSFSPYEPTGIYVKPGEEVVIQVEGTQQIKAYIGTYSYEKEEPKQFNLNPGENKISSSNGGLLYFHNYHNTGEVVAKVKKGGTTNPLFILGKHTTKDWKRMLAENPDPYAIEMKGENSLLTMHPETVAEHLKQEDPAALLKKHDEIINIEHKISGLSKGGVGVANQGKHSIHFVEDWYTDNYMYATYYRTAYSKGNLGPVLNLEELTNDGWGPWHEVGHQHQQNTWLWDGLGEVTVNIYSLAVQTTFGHKTRLEQEGRYEAAFAYLGKPDAQEKMDVFEKLVMFWQLHLAYGEQFYPNLHQMYRLLHDTELPKSDEEKKQMFIYMTSKVAGQNLIPFFDKWGLFANDATREKIEKLNLPKLEKEIWLSTDSNPIREKQTELYEVPYGEPNNEKIQNVVIGTTHDEKKAKELVQNLGEGVKTTGVIMQDKPEVGEKTLKVEIVDGKGNKNFIPVVVNVGYGDSLLVYGLKYTGEGDLKSTVTLHHGTKKFSATDTKNLIHDYFQDEKYFEFTLYDKEGKKKKNIAVKGLENTEAFAKEVNVLAFEYGDVVKVYHAESSRLHWYQKGLYVGEGKNKEIKELFFKITENGFERLKTLQEVTAKPQTVVVGTEVEKLEAKNFVEVKDGEVIGFVEKPTTTKIGKQTAKVETKDRFGNNQVTEVPLEVVYGDSIAYAGYNNDIASVVTLKHDEKKFHVTDMNSQIHKYFNKELYMGITLYDGEGKEKKRVTAEGQETSKNFAEQVNGTQFEYGDVVKVFHAEPDRLKWYQNNTLTGQGKKKGTKELFFKVTEKGFEKMDMLQEVTAVPQKVVIGTDVEKLEAKDFVQVKDGEVIGFVEKPITTKIGEQKVKVETKDRFGNKKVTEVPLEVIYGDSIMFFGTSYGGTNIKSVVTLNHEEKKFSTTDSEGPMHTSFADEKYMAMTVYDKDGKEKKTLSVKASENTKGFAEQFNEMTFEYGDIVKVYQKEFDRFKVYKKNELVDTQYGVHEVIFKVTEQGFERMEAQQEVTVVPQKVVIGTEVEKLNAKDFVQVKGGEVIGFVEKPITTKIGEQKVKVETKDRFGNKQVTEVLLEVTYGDSLLVYGLSYGGDDMKSIVTLHHDAKKMSATDTSNLIHDYFGDEKYFAFTLYNREGKEKKNIEIKGLESTEAFAKEINGLAFEYGDVVKVYHAESSRLHWYKKGVYAGEGKNKEIKELVFKITENGFERMEAKQEVTTVPQKVVIGTNADKLDAKNFVQVKDGEVIGFVEKPDTTKIGEQKAKVETKDSFGNKKVTEVSVEVTYGDSIVYQGVSNVTRSIVTLNHAEKKLHATFTNEEIHYRFVNEQYIGLTIYDQNGNEKKHVTAEGQETSKNFAGQLNGTAFEYGDVLKVYHAEPSRLNWYKKNELVKKEDAMKGQEISFKITQNGLEQVQ
ncbi:MULTISPECIES: putative mucin/carbohydrate-binding domain-containing protein [Bacillus]|uniref:putative mucin/carbohydrate-binding domain-containing protein n=1 Tax=Bacillus TaxID=1386 RepID=UPI0011459945|nr:putative mucin/carbohydrate-binding domain-containing protein [Bacillus thuringiensis]MCU5524234.1 M60 family metallopeptidase [Bacillus cereus]MCU5540693.1 M60 family metallopeptidase [Bacillus cereus]MED3265424.1 putative mucin/carbohydrate-binding domain-containing protein [Bacillus thuringiensis]MED3354127.1 putative mucin/carbohydrate-binding domain-containing protein [Bacillus thuringiensis]MED3526917.1 putative mucin/carbohydrate-binding domain-containing protein [Bacillus thuringien